MEKNKYVIGGGISGLIWNYFNPDYKIITPETGGTYGKTHMVWLHDTPETRMFLETLGFSNREYRTKRSYIGYYRNGWIHDSVSPELNLLLIQKKMTEWDKPLNTDFVPDSNKLSLGEGYDTNYMNTLDVDLVDMIDRVRERCDTMHGFVTKIGRNFIEVKDSLDDEEAKVLNYEELVSTITAPLFWRAYGEQKEFKFMPITNIVTSVKPKEFDNRYEMVYYDDSVPFTRASFLDGKYALEFSGVMPQEKFEELYPELPVDDYFVVQQGRIFKADDNKEPQDNITFLGRFAEWNHRITTEHVIQKTIRLSDS